MYDYIRCSIENYIVSKNLKTISSIMCSDHKIIEYINFSHSFVILIYLQNMVIVDIHHYMKGNLPENIN